MTTTVRMPSPRCGGSTSPNPWPCAPCSENDIVVQSTSPTSESIMSGPIPSDAANCLTSDAGSFCSRAPTPQCIPLDDIIIPENDEIFQEAMYRRMDYALSRFLDTQSRAATPCSGLDADPNTDPNMAMIRDSVRSQSSKFDWQQAGTMALDELPDSNLQYLPGYQLTQEWLDNTIKGLNEEELVAAVREVDKILEIGTDMETG